jgi:1-acyl-sn-glycerol-3-phosphate acyltransferase
LVIAKTRTTGADSYAIGGGKPDCTFAADQVSPPNSVPISTDELFDRPERSPLIGFLRGFSSVYCRLYHGLEIEAPCQMPREGPAILVCNHTSGVDPLLIQAACPRLIRWMIAREYFELPALKWVFKLGGEIPVERTGHDMAATRAALRVLEKGLVLGVFPEGKIAPTTEILPFQLGIGLLALRTGAPVYPAYLDGKQRGREIFASCVLPAGAAISSGPAVDLAFLDKTRRGVEEATSRIQKAVAILQKEHIERIRY